MSRKFEYKVQYNDAFYDLNRKISKFNDYDNALDYYKEKTKDNTGRYRNIELIEIKTVITETKMVV